MRSRSAAVLLVLPLLPPPLMRNPQQNLPRLLSPKKTRRRLLNLRNPRVTRISRNLSLQVVQAAREADQDQEAVQEVDQALAPEVVLVLALEVAQRPELPTEPPAVVLVQALEVALEVVRAQAVVLVPALEVVLAQAAAQVLGQAQELPERERLLLLLAEAVLVQEVAPEVALVREADPARGVVLEVALAPVLGVVPAREAALVLALAREVVPAVVLVREVALEVALVREAVLALVKCQECWSVFVRY
jgi:hypothetical protein